jgi:LPXTG-site transpeptidase (sortase) family protein
MIVVLLVAASFGYWMMKHFNLFGLINSEPNNLETIRNLQLGIETRPITEQEKADYQVAAEVPRYLTIEAANVKKARILPLGVLAADSAGQQQLDAPRNVFDVGWYDCQINPDSSKKCTQPARPGDGNTAVAAILDGHSCSNQSCVFNNLSNLKSGDKIMVELGNGQQLTYSVVLVEVVALDKVDMSKMLRPITADHEGLNLITCIGSWTAKDSRGLPTMDKRVMVYALRD